MSHHPPSIQFATAIASFAPALPLSTYASSTIIASSPTSLCLLCCHLCFSRRPVFAWLELHHSLSTLVVACTSPGLCLFHCNLLSHWSLPLSRSHRMCFRWHVFLSPACASPINLCASCQLLCFHLPPAYSSHCCMHVSLSAYCSTIAPTDEHCCYSNIFNFLVFNFLFVDVFCCFMDFVILANYCECCCCNIIEILAWIFSVQ